MVGCPPCQGFSLLGNRDPSDARNDLWREFVRIGLEIRPSVLVFENVPGILTLNGGSVVQELFSLLADAGYRNARWDLNAAEYGVPQTRRRVFLVATDGTDPPEPPPAARPPKVTVWDSIADLPDTRRRTRPPSTKELPYRRPAETPYAKALRGSRHRVSNCEVTRHSADLKARFRKLRAEGADQATWHRRLHPLKPAPTITAGTRTRTACRPVHPYKDRVLTVREAARLTGFPDWYRFPPTVSEAWQQIGNSVPPPLAARVFAHLKGHAVRGRRPLWESISASGLAGSRYVQQGSSMWTERRLRSLVRTLSRAYRDPKHHNKIDPLDELIFIILSAKTSEANYLKTYETLKLRFPSWDEALESAPGRIEEAIARGGLARKKGGQIRRLLRAIVGINGRADLSFLRNLSTDRAEVLLASLPGVGMKSAKCVTMYSLGRPSFPVDTHVRRVLSRLGVARISRLDDAAHESLESIIPPDLRFRLHVNALALGRDVCTARSPACPRCVANELCDYARSQGAALSEVPASSVVTKTIRIALASPGQEAVGST